MKHCVVVFQTCKTNKPNLKILKFLYFFQWCWVGPQDAGLDRKTRFLKTKYKKHIFFILGLRSVYFMPFSDSSKKDFGI